MESKQITNTLKEQLNVSRNDEILPALERVINAPPLGLTILIVNGRTVSTPIGLVNPVAVTQIEALQQALRDVANAMDRQKVELIRRDVKAELDAPVE